MRLTQVSETQAFYMGEAVKWTGTKRKGSLVASTVYNEYLPIRRIWVEKHAFAGEIKYYENVSIPMG